MAINANELRIGNYYEWSKYASMGIGIGIIKDGVDIDTHNSLREPVPLTSELLEKCGFEWKGDPYRGWYSKPVKNWRMRLWSTDENDFLFSTNEYYSTNITDLHQLQNLHFSLTGEELTINLP